MPQRGNPFCWRSAGATLVGKVRTENEDAILDVPLKGLWAVADGMGGHRGGEYASRMVVTALSTVPASARLSEFLDHVEDRLQSVNVSLYDTGVLGKRGLTGSTVLVLLAFDRFCLAAWAGDSRVYRCRSGRIEQMSRDHSPIREMRDAGLISADEAHDVSGNIITRAVGAAKSLQLEHALWSIEDGDCCLLCSDGLYKEVPESEMLLHLNDDDPERACQSLLDCALHGAAADNISAIVVRFNQGAGAMSPQGLASGQRHA